MMYHFRPRKSFERSLSDLGKLDSTIIDEVKDAILILLNGDQLPKEFHDHPLKGNLANYRDFHVRDTPKGKQPTETNDVVVIYRIEDQDLVLVAVDIGSHRMLFAGKYHQHRRH